MPQRRVRSCLPVGTPCRDRRFGGDGASQNARGSWDREDRAALIEWIEANEADFVTAHAVETVPRCGQRGGCRRQW